MIVCCHLSQSVTSALLLTARRRVSAGTTALFRHCSWGRHHTACSTCAGSFVAVLTTLLVAGALMPSSDTSTPRLFHSSIPWPDIMFHHGSYALVAPGVGLNQPSTYLTRFLLLQQDQHSNFPHFLMKKTLASSVMGEMQVFSFWRTFL